jgi:hypothetical protein
LRSSRANCRLHLDLEIINRFTSLGEVLKRWPIHSLRILFEEKFILLQSIPVISIEMDGPLLQFPRKCGENKLVKKLKSSFSTSFNFLSFYNKSICTSVNLNVSWDKSFVFVFD